MNKNEQEKYDFIIKQLKEIRYELNKLNKNLDSDIELKYCPLCGELIEEDEETMNDESDSYGGDCHENCFLEAEESRL